jgi:hypothetical protein
MPASLTAARRRPRRRSLSRRFWNHAQPRLPPACAPDVAHVNCLLPGPVKLPVQHHVVAARRLGHQRGPGGGVCALHSSANPVRTTPSLPCLQLTLLPPLLRDLSGNVITALARGAFSGPSMRNLTTLFVKQIAGLHVSVSQSLRNRNLQGNQLTGVSVGIFEGLASLQDL